MLWIRCQCLSGISLLLSFYVGTYSTYYTLEETRSISIKGKSSAVYTSMKSTGVMGYRNQGTAQEIEFHCFVHIHL